MKNMLSLWTLSLSVDKHPLSIFLKCITRLQSNPSLHSELRGSINPVFRFESVVLESQKEKKTLFCFCFSSFIHNYFSFFLKLNKVRAMFFNI